MARVPVHSMCAGPQGRPLPCDQVAARSGSPASHLLDADDINELGCWSPIPWPLVFLPPCTGLLDLIEAKESSEAPNFTQVGRRPSKKAALEEARSLTTRDSFSV